MPAYVTLSVSGIGSTASERDVRRYVEQVLPRSEPVVSDLVLDSHTGLKTTTVTLKNRGRSSQACHRAIEKLKQGGAMLDAVAFSHNLGFSKSFLDLTVLASRSSKPNFDVYFVHGLGGGAFRSFASKPIDHRQVRMWPRDFLPDVLDHTTYGKGRYLTYGYTSPIIDSDRITESIKDTAQNLLRAIVLERGANCQRPLFFVCHSLGGLVVAQAILLLLRDQELGTEMWELQQSLCPAGDCLVKGITFFGTPFRGSSLANFLSKVSTILRLPINTSHIMSLRMKDKDITEIIDEFEARSGAIELPMLAFFELLPEKLGIVKHQIVSRESAKGLGDRVRKIGLLASHRGMVKFKNPHDRLFQKNVSPAMQNLTHSALRDCRRAITDARDLPSMTIMPPRPHRLLGFSLDDNVRPPMAKHDGIVKVGMEYTQAYLKLQTGLRPYSDKETRWLSDLLDDLRFNYDTLESGRKDRLEVSPGSCQWLTKKDQYQDFICSAKNEVMFIEGGPGLGKSSLAKFLTSELATLPSYPLVTEYFSKKKGRDNSPKSIIMHILYQLYQSSEESFWKEAVEMFSAFTQQRNLEFYWALFTKVRRSLTTAHFCVIDGLDECITQQRPERQTTVDQQMVGFLRQVLGIVSDENEVNQICTTKIIFTTRYEQEIGVATAGKGVMKISSADIAESVQQVVLEKVSQLASQKNVHETSQHLIVTEILRRCGPVYQKGVTAVSILASRLLDLNDIETVSAVLDKYNFDEYDDVYAHVLERIQPQDQEMAAKIIRIIYFTRMYFDLDNLQHALAVDKENPTVEDLASLPSRSYISDLINSTFRSIITYREGESLDLEHPSIYDFLRTLPQNRLQMYSCRNEREGHLHMALICIRYLTLWRHLPVSDEELAAADGNEFNAIVRKFRLLLYAANNWQAHTREAGDLIQAHMTIVNKLMDMDDAGCITPDPEGGLDYAAMLVFNKLAEALESGADDVSGGSMDFSSQLHFLCSTNSVSLLEIYLQWYPKTNKGRGWRIWRQKSPSRLSTGTPFNLDATDKTGSTPLHYACRGGYYEIAALLVKAGARGYVADRDGYTPFARALDDGNEKIAELLLENGCAFDGGEAERGITCIHYAAYQGFQKVLSTLLEANDRDPNTKSSPGGWTPLHIAAQEGQLESVKMLIKAGGHPSLGNTNGVTSLHCAALHGHIDVIKLIFETFPNIEPSPKTVEGSDAPGSTPLNSAARSGHLKVFDFLMTKETEFVPDKQGNLPIHTAASNGHLPIVKRFPDPSMYNATNENRRTPLHLAALEDHLDVFTYLNDLGALSQADKFGYLPIHLGAANGNLSIVKLFLDSPDINATCEMSRLPIHLAAMNGHLETLKWLRANGALNMPDDDGQFPIHWAASEGHADTLREYIGSSEQDNVHVANRIGWLPIHLVAIDGHIQAARALKDLGASIDAESEPDKDLEGSVKFKSWTAMQIAVSSGHKELAVYLEQEGASLSVIASRGQGLIHLAALSGSKEIFTWLEERGADRWLRDSNGSTPLHLGACCEKVDIVETYLESRFTDQDFDLNTTNNRGLTPVMCAILTGLASVKNVLALITAGADVHTATLSGHTPLMLAISESTDEIVDILFSKDVDITAADTQFQYTALHFAAEKSLFACEKILLRGSSINAKTAVSQTPLILSVRSFKVDTVMFLLSEGAETSVGDAYGLSVFDYARGYLPISNLLKPYEANWRPCPEPMRMEKLRDLVQIYLGYIPNKVPESGTMARYSWVSNIALLATCFFHLHDFPAMRMCLETQALGSEWDEKDLDLTCDACLTNAGSTLYWCCKECLAFRGMCDKCYQDKAEKLMVGCDQEHEFLPVGGEEWVKLPYGHVDRDGRTIEDFIRELRNQWNE